MSPLVRTVVAVIACTLLAAAAGLWIGIRYGAAESRHGTPSLHEVIHAELKLNGDQRRQIEVLEAQFAVHRRELQEQMQAANRALAQAMLAEHRYGPAAQRAIEGFHAAMMALQQQTVVHVLAMRAVLTPAQALRFDQTVSQALDSNQP